MSFAKKLGFLEKGEDVNNIISTSAAVLTYIGVIGQVPYLNKLLLGNPLIPILYPAFELWDAVLIFTLEAINSCYSIVRDGELEAKEGQAVGKDMLSKWVAIKAGDPLKISTRDIVVTLSSSILAGSDSTAIVSKAILNLLLRHPEKMDKVLRELDAADAAGNFSNPISFKESQQHLPYFNAVMKESMRLHPPVGLMLERIVPPGGAEISGKYIPGGTVVGISPWVLQYNAEVFPNPSAFEPERWLDSSKEKLAEMERSFFAFGAGSRVCLGQHLAMLQLGKFLPQLLREFKISLTNPKKELVVRNNWFVQQSGFVCNLERRRK